MQPLASSSIKGTWATLLLPINRDESIDYGRLQTALDAILVSGVNGVYSGGTAGEFYAVSESEFDQVNLTMAEMCEKAGMPFQIGAAHTSAQMCLSRVKRAAAMKPSAIQVILPDWFPLADDEVLAFLERVAEVAGQIGLILYNPPHAKRILPPEFYARLLNSIPTLVGCKVGGGDAAWYASMRQYADRLSVFVPGHYLATGYKQGAAGAYSNVACLQPKGAQRWFLQMQTDIDAALGVEQRIQRFMQEYIVPFARQGYANQALDKLLAAIGGWSDTGTRLRWPYKSIAEDEAKRLRPIAHEMMPELFL